MNGGFQPKAFHFPPTRRLQTRDFSAYASGAKRVQPEGGSRWGWTGFSRFFFVGFIGFICFIRNICFDMCGLWAVVW